MNGAKSDTDQVLNDLVMKVPGDALPIFDDGQAFQVGPQLRNGELLRNLTREQLEQREFLVIERRSRTTRDQCSDRALGSEDWRYREKQSPRGFAAVERIARTWPSSSGRSSYRVATLETRASPNCAWLTGHVEPTISAAPSSTARMRSSPGSTSSITPAWLASRILRAHEQISSRTPWVGSSRTSADRSRFHRQTVRESLQYPSFASTGFLRGSFGDGPPCGQERKNVRAHEGGSGRGRLEDGNPRERVTGGTRAPDDNDCRVFLEHRGQAGRNHLMIIDEKDCDAAHVVMLRRLRTTAAGCH